MATGAPRRGVVAITFAALALLTAPARAQSAAPARAQSGPPPAERGFGRRSAFVFSVENVFGYDAFGVGNSGNISLVMHPALWGNIGLTKVYDNGLTLGGVVGLSHFFEKGADTTLVRVEPRVGLAGSAGPVGYWFRAGPSFFSLSYFDGTIYVLGVGGAAYFVILPLPHLGILVGPDANVSVFGRYAQGGDAELAEFGFTTGLMGEFW